MAIYHLNASTGSKAGGQSAAAKADYLARAGRYTRDREEVAYVESGNMPDWVVEGRGRAEGAGMDYWRQADAAERSNGVLFRQVEAALPNELTLAESIELAHRFANELATVEGGKLPYTLAIHDKPGNRHFHLVLSERVNDGIARDRDAWFKRAANQGKDPASGGARKADIGSRRGDWLADTRQRWAERANEALAEHGHSERIDHRSHAKRGIEQQPSAHIGPNAKELEKRTGQPSMRRQWVQARNDLRAPLPRIAAPRAAVAAALAVPAPADTLVALRPQNAPTALQTALAALSKLEGRRHELEQRRVAAFAGLGRLGADLAGRADWMAAARTGAREPERPALAAGERAERLQRLNGELAAASHECGQRAGTLPERVRQATDRVLRSADQAAGRAVARKQAQTRPTFTSSLDTFNRVLAEHKARPPSTDNSMQTPHTNPMAKALEARRLKAAGGTSMALDATMASASAMASAKSPHLLKGQLLQELLALTGRVIELVERVREATGTIIAGNEKWAAMHHGRDTLLIDREKWAVEVGYAYRLTDGPNGPKMEPRPVNRNTASTLEYVYGKRVGELASQWAERDKSLTQTQSRGHSPGLG